MANQRLIIYIIDAFKTMNQKLKRNLLPKDTSYLSKNLRYDSEYGSLVKRTTRAKYNSVSLGSAAITSIYRFYKNSTVSAALLGVTSGILKIGYDAQGVFSNLKTGLNQTNNFTFLTYKDLCYIIDGEDANMVFGLASITGPIENMGVPSLVSSPSATVSAAAGNLGNANYYYAVSQQFDSYQEGSIGPSSAGTNPNISKMTVALPTSANSRSTGLYIYRTKSGASTFYRLATVSRNTTAYIDNIADTSLDTTIIAPIDYGTPVSCKYACLHDERVFLTGDKNHKSWIYYSDIRSGSSYPDVFPSGNILKIAENDGDENTTILNDNLGQFIVFKKNSVRIINTPSGSDLTWTITDSYSPQGCVAPYSAVTTPLGIIYITRYGELKRRLQLWVGAGIKVIPELEGIEPILTAIPETAMADVRGHYHNGYYYLAYRTEGLYNDKVLVINLLDWSCVIDNKNVACFSSWNGGTDFGELYTGSSDNQGFIDREDASSFDLLIRKKSEIDAGSFSQTASGGTEEAPTLGLISALTTSNVAGKSWVTASNASDVWGYRSTTNDAWWFTGEWYDAIREISAKALSSLLWTEISPTGTDIVFYVRTGNTQAACATAAWSDGLTNPGGSNLAAVSAAKYIQIQAKFATQIAADWANVYLKRSGSTEEDFVIKISANYGSPAEVTIEFDWQSGRFDLGDINEAYKRLRKRVRSVKVEYEPENGSTGSFDFALYLNGSATQINSFATSFSDYPKSRIYTYPLGIYCDDFIYRIYSNSDTKGLKIRKVIFTLSVEPYYSLR